MHFDTGGSSRDDTSRSTPAGTGRQTEKTMRERETHLRTLLETIPDLIWLKDPDGVYISCNPKFERFFGAREEEIVGRTDYDFVDRDLADFFRQKDQEAMAAGRPVMNEEEVVYADDGHREFLETVKTPMYDASGELVGVLGVARDITTRKKAELALAARQRELEVLHRISEIALRNDSYQLTLENIVREVTAALGFPIVAIEYYHGSRQEMELAAISGCPPPSDGARSCVPVTRTPSGLVAASGKLMIETRVGERPEPEFAALQALGVRTYLCVPMFSGSQVLGTLSLSSPESDVLDEQSVPIAKSLANFIAFIIEHRRGRDEKASLVSQLQQAQKMEAVGRLAGGVAHDFNNMLGVILGQTELLLNQADPSEQLFASLQEIRKAARSSANLTRQLLAFARKQAIDPKPVDLNHVVESMIKMLQRIIGEDIHLAWLPGKELWRVMLDPGQIDQILANLCVNARDAIDGVGKVTIETGNRSFDDVFCNENPGYLPGDYVLLAISDSGCGMSEQTLASIFEPFFTTKVKGKGTGLGLATVYGIVRQHNGFIVVDSSLGAGTRFNIYFPRFAAGSPEDSAEGAEERIVCGSGTVLIVEDNEAIAKISAMMLEQQGYTVLTATSPGEAIRLVQERGCGIDLLITDVIMPEMNGRDLARSLSSVCRRMKVLFMSGYTADVIAHHGVLEKGIHFLQKPFSMQELNSKVCEVLKSNTGS